MPVVQLTGSRIRERRLDKGMRQADLAAAAAISPSYLNLIEHNKRRIGGKLLGELARALQVDPAALSEGADRAILDKMQAAAAREDASAETGKAEEFATRYPGWAGVIATQEDRLEQLEAEVQLLRDRMTHDPELATALHSVITAVTSIRATAGILVSDDKVDADWQRRFHININEDARKLATQSEALVSYLDTPQSENTARLSAAEQVDALLADDVALRTQIETAADGIAPPADLSPAASALFMRRLKGLRSDIDALPLAEFVPAARAGYLDPAALAAQFGVDLPTVLRRLAALPDDAGLRPMGLVVCDGAGAITQMKATAGFAMSRRTIGCPLWPVFTALSQPNRPLRTEVILPDAAQTRFLCFAIAQPKVAPGFDSPPVMEATMLVLPDPTPGPVPPQPLGTACQICPRKTCPARREASVLG